MLTDPFLQTLSVDLENYPMGLIVDVNNGRKDTETTGTPAPGGPALKNEDYVLADADKNKNTNVTVPGNYLRSKRVEPIVLNVGAFPDVNYKYVLRFDAAAEQPAPPPELSMNKRCRIFASINLGTSWQEMPILGTHLVGQVPADEWEVSNLFSTNRDGYLWIEGIVPGEVFLVLELRHKTNPADVKVIDRIRFEVNADRALSVSRKYDANGKERYEWEPNDNGAPTVEDLSQRHRVRAEKQFSEVVGMIQGTIESVSPLLTWRPNRLGQLRSNYSTSIWVGYQVPGELKWAQAGLVSDRRAHEQMPRENVYIEYAKDYTKYNPKSAREWWVRTTILNPNGVGKWRENILVTVQTIPDSDAQKPIDEKKDMIKFTVRDLNENIEREVFATDVTGAKVNLISRHAKLAQAGSELSASVTRLPGMLDKKAKISDIFIGGLAAAPQRIGRFGAGDLGISILLQRTVKKVQSAAGPLSALHFNIGMDGQDGIEIWDKYYWGRKDPFTQRWIPHHPSHWETPNP